MRALWNALTCLQDEDYPLTGDRMHTRWGRGLWYEVKALLPWRLAVRLP